MKMQPAKAEDIAMTEIRDAMRDIVAWMGLLLDNVESDSRLRRSRWKLSSVQQLPTSGRHAGRLTA